MKETSKETRVLLAELKKVGYERVTVYVSDKRVPDSVRIKRRSFGGQPGKADYGAYWGREDTQGFSPPRVVCAAPKLHGECQGLPGNQWPKIWDVFEKSDLMGTGGSSGNGQGFSVGSGCIHLLTAGYYEL